MKKLMMCFTASLALISSLAMAKTEGNSVELNLLRSEVEGGDTTSFEIDGIGLGLAAQHAINLGQFDQSLNNFFVAPGAFLDFNEADGSYGLRTGQAEVSRTQGIDLDIGYDVNDQIAIFATIGYIEARVDVRFDIGAAIFTETKTEESLFYGLGARYAIDNQLTAVVSYNFADLQEDRNGVGGFGNMDISTDVIKLGVAYNF